MRPSACTATARATKVSRLVSVDTRPSPEKLGSRSPGAASAGGASAARAASAAATNRALTSMSSPTLTADGAPALDDGLAVCGQPAALAQVADHVPVDGRLVRAARLRIRAADRE